MCFDIDYVLLALESSSPARHTFLLMSRIDLVSKNLLADYFRNCRKENGYYKSIEEIAKIAKVTRHCLAM